MRLRLMSDVPLGAMLSGGLDSSLIVALMARNMSEPVKTFSVGFVEDGDENELADARLVAEHFGADHHELELSVSEQRRPRRARSGTSTSRSRISPRSASSRSPSSRRSHVTVALSGQGADELLAATRSTTRRPLAGALVSAARPGPRSAADGRSRARARRGSAARRGRWPRRTRSTACSR